MHQALAEIRNATRGTNYEGHLYLVGGAVRDKLLGQPQDEDVDIVLEGNAAELAGFLFERGISETPPVTFPRFGTAVLSIADCKVEFVGARRESYRRGSRKPATQPASLLEDAIRRDFTINTLLENLHTGEVRDLTGLARRDIEDRVIRTPQDPETTFDEDPLRMMRAVRFATRLGFAIHPETYRAINRMASRLEIVSAERIRDEFVKISMSQNAVMGLDMLRTTGLLDRFAPEMSAMHGLEQNVHHAYDVWTHTMKTLESTPLEWGNIVRMAALLHDIGKVPTRSVGPDGAVHFYRHEKVGAEMARKLMRRLRFSNWDIEQVSFLISMHLRVGEYDHQWSDAAVRRLMRDAGDRLEDLIRLTVADKRAAGPGLEAANLPDFRARLERVRASLAGQRIESPLDGEELIALLGIEPGPKVGAAKKYLEEQVVEGNLRPGDKAAAVELARSKFGQAR